MTNKTILAGSNMNANLSKRMYKEMRSAERWLIVPHQHPDGDALGAATALAGLADSLNIPWKIYCSTQPPDNLRFLPFAENITSDPTIWSSQKWPLIILVDSGDLIYAGVANHLTTLDHKPILAIIDHHESNTRYGDYNLVIQNASSTNEILYQFFLINNITVTEDIATSLLTGIITDTGMFTNSATSRTALKIGGELIKHGANLKQIHASILKDKTLPRLKLWGVILERLTLHNETQVAFTYVTLEDIAKHGAKDDETEGLINMLNFLNEGVAVMMLKELQDGTIKGSFRTTREDINVLDWAKRLGGGGHKKAAGFTIQGTITEAFDKIWSEITTVI